MEETTPVNNERKPTTGHWAQMCSKSITDHLAPKGFSTIRSGVFRGKEKANIEFLERKQVEIAGKIAAGCVGHYRNRLKEYYKSKKNEVLSDAKAVEDNRNSLPFWKWKSRAECFRKIESLHLEASLLEEIEKELDYLTIK